MTFNSTQDPHLGDQHEEIQINFTETIPAGAGVKVSKNFTLPGSVTQVMFSFPPGCSGLVDAKLEKDLKSFYPRSGWLSLDNATPVYYTHSDYYAREPLTFIAQNRDDANPHTITCTVVIRFERPDWWF